MVSSDNINNRVTNFEKKRARKKSKIIKKQESRIVLK